MNNNSNPTFYVYYWVDIGIESEHIEYQYTMYHWAPTVDHVGSTEYIYFLAEFENGKSFRYRGRGPCWKFEVGEWIPEESYAVNKLFKQAKKELSPKDWARLDIKEIKFEEMSDYMEGLQAQQAWKNLKHEH